MAFAAVWALTAKGAAVRAMAITVTSAAAGRWNTPNPGRSNAGRLRTVAAISAIKEMVNSAQQIHAPAAITTAAS